ncbi:hypothetical protein [Paraburkholderia bannensis]|uniref:hypothetical protein n=1 Tax=Paraburkholderia bannensis TaxID=765414 RepID=UPI002ABE99EB|nr:hypothetical protein [Paraburkholderia bannensis]
MMDAVDKFEAAHGVYPVAFDRRWHCGVHLAPDTHGAVYAIADGEVVAYRVCQHAIDSGNSNAGFVLLRHSSETGEGRAITFYSLYMHLLPLAEYYTFGYNATGLADFLRRPTGQVPQGQVEPAVAGSGRKIRRKDIVGYEMLRFGRILSTPATLSGDACATWVQVTFASGKLGYIDINTAGIKKLSDADFPSFMGWQKLGDGSTPFGSDGLCDIDALKKIVGDAAASEKPTVSTATTEVQKAGVLSDYVKGNDGVRQALRGFICNAPSEWDSTNNEMRYAKLLDDGGFYHGNDEGYNKFLTYLKEIQFWDVTGIPAGQKLWFFHPLAFIRHFRKCAWFTKNEFAMIYPDSYISGDANAIREKYRKPLNFSLRKYGMSNYLTQSHFLGQGAVESNFLCTMQESSMVGNVTATAVYGTHTNPISEKSEKTLGHWYGAIPSEDDPWYRSAKYNSLGHLITSSYDWRGGNCDREDAQKFRGRGFKQLTFRSNYADYWLYRGWIQQSSFTASWWSDHQYHAKNRALMTKIPARVDNPEVVATESGNCLDSGAWYITCLRSKVVRAIDNDSYQLPKTAAELEKEERVIKDVTKGINGGLIGIDKRVKYTRMIKKVLL